MAFTREPPIYRPATTIPHDIKHAAAIILMHGFGDSADGWESVATQFQNANKLPYLQWVFPNAPENRDARAQAWYMPTALLQFPSSRPELEEPEDEDGLRQSVDYVVGLIDDLVEKGIPPDRIVLSGFSQGCAMTLLTGLTSKYAGKLAGLGGLMGYLPLANRIQELRSEAQLPKEVGNTPIFFVRGTKDMLVPKRIFTESVQKLREFGVKDEFLELHEYDGLGHTAAGVVLRDLCSWLEKIIPPLE